MERMEEAAAAHGDGSAATNEAAEVTSGLPSGSGGWLMVLQRADPDAKHVLCFGNALTQMAVMDLLLEVQLQQVRKSLNHS